MNRISTTAKVISFTKKDLFEAFSHYAFTSISNQPYSEGELLEEFEKWFKHKYSK